MIGRKTAKREKKKERKKGQKEGERKGSEEERREEGERKEKGRERDGRGWGEKKIIQNISEERSFFSNISHFLLNNFIFTTLITLFIPFSSEMFDMNIMKREI